MSFPGTYNISYYYGDTLEFRVYPKNSSGEDFDLASFQLARFTLAPTRDSAEDAKISAYATIDPNKTNVLCAITPDIAASLSPGTEYIYDVEISKNGTPYNIVYTLLTGTVSITKDITKTETNVVTTVPNNPTNMVFESATFSTITVSWTPPVGGDVVEFYRVAAIPYTTNTEAIESAITSSEILISGGLTQHTFVDLQENSNYSLIVLSNNAIGDASAATLLTNAQPFTTADNPVTLDPDYRVTATDTIEYLIDGVGGDDITVIRGETYIINVQASGQPFWIQSVAGGYDAENIYDIGITNNGTEFGNIIWQVDPLAPDTLYYSSENSFTMNGQINVIDDGGS